MNPSLELLLDLFVSPVDCTFIYLLFVSPVDYILVRHVGSTRPNDLGLLLETHHHYNLAWLSSFCTRLDC